MKLNDNQGDTGDSAYETPVNTRRDSGDDSVVTSHIRTKKRDFARMKCLMSPILRRGYYRRKKCTRGHRHSVSSTLEYMAGSTLQASSRKIPFYTLLLATSKPNQRNKKQPPLDAFMLCDTGASISLAPEFIAQKLGMRIDKSEMGL